MTFWYCSGHLAVTFRYQSNDQGESSWYCSGRIAVTFWYQISGPDETSWYRSGRPSGTLVMTLRLLMLRTTGSLFR